MKKEKGYIIPFILVASCFALWGFANDITNPMVNAFSKIFRISGPDKRAKDSGGSRSEAAGRV